MMALIIFIFTFIVIIIAAFIDVIGQDYKYALIGAMGSVIGGVLTLIGVMWTIKRQEKVDRLNKLPSDIINLWKIQKQFGFPVAIYHNLPEDPYKNDEEIFDEFYKENEEWVTELSAQISAKVYSQVNSFFTHISDFSTYKRRKELDIWFDKAFEYQDKLGEIIDSYEKDYERLR